MLTREELIYLFDQFSDLISHPDVKKRIVDAVADNQGANFDWLNMMLINTGSCGCDYRYPGGNSYGDRSRFGHNYTSLHTRLTTTLLKPFLDQKWSLTQHYGAVQGLAALGPNVEMRIVKKQNDNLKKNMDNREGSCKCSKSSGPNWLGIKHLIDWSLLLRIILPELLSDPSPS
ncbi:transcription initiation factor TFIID subunit 6 isoform X1 [Tanacetum coccineum]